MLSLLTLAISINSISCHTVQGGQGKYFRAAHGDCRVSLSPTVSLTDVANVNNPLLCSSQMLAQGWAPSPPESSYLKHKPSSKIIKKDMQQQQQQQQQQQSQ